MESKEKLPLRLGVGIVLLNNKNQILVGKRIDNPKDSWQMPQGGVNKNEDFLIAAKRELEEETGVKTIKLIKELDEWLVYDLPANLLGKIWKGKYRGQRQKWFIMKFAGKNNEINVNTKNPEFSDWKWINIKDLTKVAVTFKINVYKKIKEKLNSLGIN